MFAIAAKPISIVDTATTPATPLSPRTIRPAIIIKEPAPEEPTQKEVPEGKGKKKVKRAPTVPPRDTTPFPIKRARREAVENKLTEEAWL